MRPGVLKINILLALLLHSKVIDIVKGLMEISPSGVAPVCLVGDQLELTCSSSSGIEHRWEFTVFPENVTYTPRPITFLGASGIPTSPLTISTSTITFSRLSGQGSLPLVSRIVVSPVSSGLNGTVVNCFEGSTSTDSVAATTIYIIGDNINILNSILLGVRRLSELFSSDGISVVLEWNVSNVQIYHQQLLQNISINVVPNPIAIRYAGNRTFQLTLIYNTLYNVSIIQPGICGQSNQTVFTELNYNPAMEGENITFSCLSGTILSGPNSSTCMGNGEWEPDPGEVTCTHEHELVTAGTTMPRISDPSASPAIATTQMLRTALISVTCVLSVMSVLTFIIGFVNTQITCLFNIVTQSLSYKKQQV